MASTTEFSRTLSLLRQERGVSQRTAAADLGISQALLSHYENGIREPGLSFVVRACDYYNVSADFILGRTLSREGSMMTHEEVLNAAEPGNILQGSVLATLQSKLLSGAIGVLFGLLGKLGDKTAINSAAAYLGKTCLCIVYGGLHYFKLRLRRSYLVAYILVVNKQKCLAFFYIIANIYINFLYLTRKL